MKTTRVLLAEDNPGDVVLTRHLLCAGSSGEFELTASDMLEGAVQRLRNDPFDLVLLDLNLPDSKGLESLRRILDQAPDLPIVVLTGSQDTDMAMRAVREGAQDYVLKGSVDAKQLAFTLRSSILRKESEQRLARRAFYDDLTGLPTRALLRDRWERVRTRQKRSGGWIGVLVIDLDDFKTINDDYGHMAGDIVLVTVARRVEGILRRGDTLSRIGGDEFVLLLEDIHGIEDAEMIVQKVAAVMAEPINYEGLDIAASASTGVAISHPSQPEGLYDVVRRADLDMYDRKKSKDAILSRFDRMVSERRQHAVLTAPGPDLPGLERSLALSEAVDGE